MATLDKVERGIIRFVDQDILPHINAGWNLSFMGTSITLPAGMKKAVFGTAGAGLAKKASAALSQMGMVAEDGTVDLDVFLREFLPRMPQEGFLIGLPGGDDMRLTSRDVETLHRYIIEA
jgi:hypothetical protein